MNKTSRYILVKVSGPDFPGITANLLKVIAQNNYAISDMGQSVTHGLLSLSILLDIPDDYQEEGDSVLKDLLFTAKRMGLTLDFEIMENGDHVRNDGEKFILNCVSTEKILPEVIRDIAAVMAEHGINILRIDNVSGLGFKSLQMTTTSSTKTDMQKVKGELIRVSDIYKTDIAFIADNLYRRSKRLILFDMDSTLIQAEVIDEMARKCGVYDQVSKITERAMNGELDFDESLKLRVSQLKGLTVQQMQEISDTLPLTPGVEEFILTVKKLGFKLAVVSGGFDFFTKAIKQKLNLDYAFANELEIVDGKLTGNLKGTIINAQQKAIILDLIAQQEGLNNQQVVAIGDGANDLPMLAKAGLGIAFHAKEVVKRRAGQQMSHGPMTSILYFLGIH